MREKIQRFMMGRYGNDNLNQCLILGALVVMLLELFLHSTVLMILGYLIWGCSIYRMFSRKIDQRYQENMLYLNKTKGLRHRFSCFAKGLQDRRNRYFTCPFCAQIVRVPKGRGKIEITCPSCHRHFDRKS